MVEPICAGKDCLIIGSAPDVIGNLRYLDDRERVIIAANSGGRIALDHFNRLDILVTTSHLTQQKTDYEKRIFEQVRGLKTDTLYVDEKSGRYDIQSGIEFNRLIRIDQIKRVNTVKTACGLSYWVSSGVWSVCLAVASGARDIQVAGISLANGHYGIKCDVNNGLPTRDHIEADRHVMQKLGFQIC